MNRERKFKLVKLVIYLLGVCLLCQPLSAAEEEEKAHRDLSGRWRVHLRNDIGWKACTFVIEQEEGRLRGKVLVAGAPEINLDGKFGKDNEILLWAVYRDGRTGASTDLEFKGVYEGEPGQEVLTGKSHYFDKRYNWTAKRKKKKKKG
jgi:hypothetical protein